MKRDLIILHGALGSSSQFTNSIPFLEDNFNLIFLDFPGHGINEESNENLTIENCALYLQNQFKAFPTASIFGYSMGGYVALWAAYKQFIKPTSIMTLATKFNWTAEFAAKETRMMELDNLKQIAPAFIENLQKQHGAKWELLLEKTSAMMTGLGNQVLLGEPELSTIDVPVCIAVGFKDKMVSVEESLWAARSIPKAELEIFPKMQHPAERINWEQLSFSMNAFLS